MKLKVANIIFLIFLVFEISVFLYARLVLNSSVGFVPIFLTIILPTLLMVVANINARRDNRNSDKVDKKS